MPVLIKSQTQTRLRENSAELGQKRNPTTAELIPFVAPTGRDPRSVDTVESRCLRSAFRRARASARKVNFLKLRGYRRLNEILRLLDGGRDRREDGFIMYPRVFIAKTRGERVLRAAAARAQLSISRGNRTIAAAGARYPDDDDDNDDDVTAGELSRSQESS